jgi:AcrR family transcriptional regulator
MGSTTLKDRRQEILKAAFATMREYGFSGFTQPRVATRAGVRQSHLTYYFPTRVALLQAVARVAIDGQLTAIDAIVASSSPRAAATSIAGIVARHENSRVIMALAQGADEEPSLRILFRELADAIALKLAALLKFLNIDAAQEHIYLLHALSVGLGVVDLATQRPHSKRRTAAVIEAALKLISAQAKRSKRERLMSNPLRVASLE